MDKILLEDSSVLGRNSLFVLDESVSAHYLGKSGEITHEAIFGKNPAGKACCHIGSGRGRPERRKPPEHRDLPARAGRRYVPP